MVSIYLIAAGWLAVAALYKLMSVVRLAYFSPLSKIPGPWHAKLSNLGLKLAVLSGRRCHYIHSVHQTYGSIARVAPDEIAVADVTSFKEIHRIGGGFTKTLWYTYLNTAGIGKNLGVFSIIDPKQHAQRRKLLARGFSANYLREQWEATVLEKTELAVQRIKAEASTGTADLLKWWILMATDISASLMFGESFHTLELGQKVPYIHAIEAANIGTAVAWEAPPLAWLGRLLSVVVPSLHNVFYANETLAEQGKIAVANSKKAGHASNVFATIINEGDKEDGGNLSAIDVQFEASNLLLAGTDTTGNTLTFLTWAVLRQPTLRAALENELSTISMPYTDAALEGLPILNAVIEEALRLYGAAPGTLPRNPPKGGANIGGYYIPEGTVVGTQAYSLHRDPTLFPNPETFDHTRWLPENTSSTKVSDAARAAFSPFGAGTRVCLGIHLARMELRLATATFFRECKTAQIAPSMMDKSMEIENFFLISPAGHKCEIVL